MTAPNPAAGSPDRGAASASVSGSGFSAGLSPLACGLGIALLSLLADRLSKWWLLDPFGIGTRPPVRLAPFFNLVMVWNPGVSFGLFSRHAGWGRFALTAFALIVAVALLVWMARARSKFVACGLGLIVGGAVSNAWDRVAYGAVADFFDFHLAGYHWYAFNVADAAITVGAGFLLLDSLFGEQGRRR